MKHGIANMGISHILFSDYATFVPRNFSHIQYYDSNQCYHDNNWYYYDIIQANSTMSTEIVKTGWNISLMLQNLNDLDNKPYDNHGLMIIMRVNIMILKFSSISNCGT